MAEEITGVVKWFSNQKGYGFITRENGGKDVFVHHAAVVGEGYKTLAEGQRVKFQIVHTEKGDQASNVVKL
ncbi:MAG: cold shock domain-containing protein [Candidatus Omnitrophota bacterium]